MDICKWYNNANSPVLFMIDDLANVWVDLNGNGLIDLGEDWGYAKRKSNSSFKYLEDEILDGFKQVKTTFFLPTGIRVGMLENPTISSVSKMINCDIETIEFLKGVNDDIRYEIAYHGTTHGKVGGSTEDFIQEWQTYTSLEEAIKTIETGKKIFKEVFGYYPSGGKYCGYATNEFSNDSIDKSGFLWWCREWNRGKKHKTANDFRFEFDIKEFGKNSIIDIPSTLALNITSSEKSIKSIVKNAIKKMTFNQRIKQIEFLLANKLVISIQEHMSPARDDGRVQNPNIFDDAEYLKRIFKYLINKNVWFCTCTELAEYYILRKNSTINFINDNKFSIKYNSDKKIKWNKLSIVADNEINHIRMPDRKVVNKVNGCFDIEVMDGIYEVLI